MNTDLMFSSKTDKWSTPQWLFDRLNNIFCFTLDACADDVNHKCKKYFTEEQNGLNQSWGGVQNILQSPIWQTDWRVGKKSI